MSLSLEKVEAWLDEFGAHLTQLKTQHGLHCCTSSNEWKNLCLRLPDNVKKTIVFLETLGGPLDFNELDSWLEQVKAEFDKRKSMAAELGLDFGTLSRRDLATKSKAEIVEKIAGNIPGYKVMPNHFGPNWFSHWEAMCDLSGLREMPPQHRLPRNKIMPSIVKVANRIIELWKTLGRMKGEGRVEFFKSRWDPMHLEGRMTWLQQFPKLHHRPDQAICALAQGPEERLSQDLFSSPLLNIEDLAQANVLPEFLQTRIAIHPKAFYSVDSRFVGLGYWHNMFLKLYSEGRISFFSETAANAEDCPYGMQFEPDSLRNLHLTNPATGYHSLVAQQKTYEFLVSCLSTQLPTPRELPVELTANTDGVDQSKPLSLLNRAALLHYGRPDDVRWSELADMSKASADEALDDLWQLRHDAQYWNMRLTDMHWKTSQLLRSVFGRIDMFLTVDEKLRSSSANQQTGFLDDLSVVRLSCDDTRIKSAIHMHSTFRAILNEILLSIQGDEWLRKDQTNVTLRYLFHLMADNHPTIRLIGFDTMLRTIDRELSDGTAPEVPPFPIVQALHDMSVVAACMQETSKHYHLISNYGDRYARLANNAASEWGDRERPWYLLVQTLLKWVKSRENELNKAARNEKIPLEQRHRQFWNRIDDCMLSRNASNPIVRAILDQAPVQRASAPQSASKMVETSWNSPSIDLPPTDTQKSKSSRRRRKPKGSSLSNASRPNLGAFVGLTKTEPQSRPSIYLTKGEDIGYWESIRNDKGQQRFDSWKEFLTRIGFAVSSKMGSIYTFNLTRPGGESHTINFHDLHGWNGNELPHRLARSRWAKRLERHFNIIVSENGATLD